MILNLKPNRDYKKKKLQTTLSHEHKTQKSLTKDSKNCKKLLQKHWRWPKQLEIIHSLIDLVHRLEGLMLLNVNSPYIVLKRQYNRNQIPAGIFVEIEKLISKMHRVMQRARTPKTVLETHKKTGALIQL